ncbi:MAG TPA: hypothetical protein VJB87_03235 [Candidatus Nanoarchaeia archaeon]|nr:hypothetical protein [Candidatus Nanoarchaeia archaeon]
MLTIILDTDFLLNILRRKIRLEQELTRILDQPYQLVILSNTLKELQGKKDGKLALTYAQRHTIQTTNQPGTFDDAVHNYPHSYVATQDKALKEKLKKEDFGIITIRQQNHLIIEHVLRN